jgi:O-antigen ligase
MKGLTKNSDRQLGLELSLIIFMGVITSFSLVFASALEAKWMLFITIALVCIAAVFVIPKREKFFLCVFFFTLPIGLNFYPIYIYPMVFRPFNGFAIYLYDLPFFFLFLFWVVRVVINPQEKIYFYPWISIPFLLIFAFAIAGINRSLAPGVIKFSSLWVIFECWLVFLYMANNLKDSKTIYLVMYVLLSTLVLQAGIGFAQKFTGGHLGLAIFGEAEQSFREMRAGVGTVSRVGGTIGSPNKLAGYIGLILPINLALFFAPIGRRYKIILLLPLFIMSAALELVTFSRGGWVGLGIGGAITLYWCLARLTKRKVISLILLVTLLVTSFISTIALMESVRRRLFKEDYGAAYTRIPMALVATNMIYHNPLLGVGLVNYTSVSAGYDISREAISYTFPMPVHNEFLLVASELGLPALGLFVLILIVVFVQLIRIGRSHADPIIPHVAIGFFGGFIAWCIHHQFEFAYVVMMVPIWSYVGLIQAMYQVTNTDIE